MTTLNYFRYLLLFGLALPVLFLYSCTPRVSVFNEAAYRQAVELKVASLNLLDKATTDYSENREAVDNLKLDLLTAWEYAKGRPDNEAAERLWESLLDPEDNLLADFLIRWEERERLPPAMIREYKLIISDAFDRIIALESGKSGRTIFN